MRASAALCVGSAVLGSILLAPPRVMADDAMFWVVGSTVKGCQIARQNPVVNFSLKNGDVAFSDGPYKSKGDAKLAMKTINVCKKKT
jgi:hypothetical protein